MDHSDNNNINKNNNVISTSVAAPTGTIDDQHLMGTELDLPHDHQHENVIIGNLVNKTTTTIEINNGNEDYMGNNDQQS
ncbi:hypothetical protein BLOT_014375, partial [Blomia tropicalis]